MKKLFAMLFTAGALALTACQPNIYSANDTQAKLKDKGYTVEVFSYEEAKVRIKNLNYDIVSFNNAVYAEKGTEENKDLLIAFYFATIDDASKFMDGNNYENMGLLNTFGQNNLGSNLTVKVGTHNNVAYVGSQTSFSAAFE